MGVEKTVNKIVPTQPTPYCMWMPHTGVWIDTLNPDYTEAKAIDIALPLSMIHRYTGQLPMWVMIESWRASVLTHSCLCYDIAEGMGITDEKILRTIFFHDAQEAIVQDVSGPMKKAMREVARRGDVLAGRVVGAEAMTSDYDQIEDRHEWALAQRFDLYMPKAEIVHVIDRMAFSFEVLEFFGEERLYQREVSEDPSGPECDLARQRRNWYTDPQVGLRLAQLLAGES